MDHNVFQPWIRPLKVKYLTIITTSGHEQGGVT